MYSLEELQKIVQKSFEEERFIHTPENLYEPIDYTLSDGGKRIRPVFALLACQMFGGNPQDALAPAMGLEVFHNFTLLHDDIMDQSLIRRGKETVYRKWNTNIAILSGDTMFAMAYKYFLKNEYPNQLEILRLFTQTAIEICEGQQYDMNFEQEETILLEDYLLMIRLKTAVLLAASLKTGALIANASPENCNRIYDLGIALGLAFQLQDDYLDCYGDTKTFGKKTGTDIIDKKKTFLYIKALQKAEDKQRIRLIDLMKSDIDPETKVREVKQVYEQLDIQQITNDEMVRYTQDALILLQGIKTEESSKEIFRQMIQKLMGRDS